MYQPKSFLDQHGQPKNMAFCAAHNKDKVVMCLGGIIRGMHVDGDLSDAEILFLRAWLDSVNAFDRDGDILDLAYHAQDILEDGKIDAEEREDILNSIDTILEYGATSFGDIDLLVNELIGFCKGIAADDSLSNEEILALREHITEHEGFADTWPACDLLARIDQVMEDEVISDEEREDLFVLIKACTGSRFVETGLAEGFAVHALCEPLSEFDFAANHICFTGKCLTASRRELERVAYELGAVVRPNISKKTRLLVLGTLASRDWMFTSHGRKIEKALTLKRSGHDLRIVDESTWYALAARAYP